MSDVYVVLASQLNRWGDKDKLEPLKRGAEFTAADVTEAELDRWLSLKPKVIALEADIEKAQQSVADAQERIAELEAELAATAAERDAALTAGGAPLPTPEGEAVEEPAGNASRDAWAAYAASVDDEYVDDENVTRDDLKAKYGTPKG